MNKTEFIRPSLKHAGTRSMYFLNLTNDENILELTESLLNCPVIKELGNEDNLPVRSQIQDLAELTH